MPAHTKSAISSAHIAVIGIDIGKNVFHLIGLDSRGAIVLKCKLSRSQLENRLANTPLDLPRFRGEAWRWVSVADWRSWRRPPCGCSSLVRPQRSPFLHPGPCAGSAVAHSPCQARAFCAPARACA